MTTLLLLIIYIAFIGLGIPDSLFGAAWPAIYRDLHLPLSSANYITLFVSGCTVISSTFSAHVIHRFGTGVVTAVSTVATALALLGFSFSHNVLIFCLLSIPLGLGAGAIDTALNNYVALHYKAMHMNFLHCFYGVGVSLSPYLLSLVLTDTTKWRSGYRTVFLLQLFIAILTVVTIPLWKKVGHGSDTNQSNSTVPIKITTLFRIPAVLAACFVFFGSCAIEATNSTWGSTFLVNAKGMSVDYAAQTITFYYVGIVIGRFLSGILSNKRSGWQLILYGESLTLCAILLLILPFPTTIASIALFLIGVGNAPLFPNMIQMTPIHFGRNNSQSVIGAQMAVAYVGVLLTPPLFGLIAQYIHIGLFPYYLLVMYVIMMFSIILMRKHLHTLPDFLGEKDSSPLP